MTIHRCPTCGAEHTNELPEGAWVYWSGSFPVLVCKGDKIILTHEETTEGTIEFVWLQTRSGTKCVLSHRYLT